MTTAEPTGSLPAKPSGAGAGAGVGAPGGLDGPVQGQGAVLRDLSGRQWIDCRSPVPHVGHCHPHVVSAVSRQLAELSHAPCTGRQLLEDYLQRLLPGLHGSYGALPAPDAALAADLALGIARAATGAGGIIAFEGASHGGTEALRALQPRPGGRPAGNVRLIAPPDPADPDRLGRDLHRAILDLEETGAGVAALILCPLLARQGVLLPGAAALAPAFAMLRRAGGLVIADETAGGFGRCGSHFWAHQTVGLEPEILVLGAGMGNGFPVAAVLARPELLADFNPDGCCPDGMGANPAAMAAAGAVLDVLGSEALPRNAARQGARLLERLQRIGHPRLDGIRGAGLMIGVGFRRDGLPDPGGAATLLSLLAAQGVLAAACGGAPSVLRLCPPLCLDDTQADALAAALERALDDLPE